MYLIISIIASLIFTQQIACADTPDEAPIAIARIIHHIYYRTTNQQLSELLKDRDACVHARSYMARLHASPEYQVSPEISNLNREMRREAWQTVDSFVYQFLTREKHRLSPLAEPDFVHNPALKALLIANAMFQHEWLLADRDEFLALFFGALPSMPVATPKKSARVPRARSKRHIW
jgi:hypothetical protein